MQITKVRIVQLPFPSQYETHSVINRYYSLYLDEYKKVFTKYHINETDLWEAPLWVAHLDSALNVHDTELIDLSQVEFDSKRCLAILEEHITRETLFVFSPLAQNLTLCSEVSRQLLASYAHTVVGGNVTELVDKNDFTLTYGGIAGPSLYSTILSAIGNREKFIYKQVVVGRSQEVQAYNINYRLLKNFRGRVPLIRINASHGCLLNCNFCGDAWSRQLHVVPYNVLENEFQEIVEYFPNFDILYVGDKTFGQSQAAIENLQKLKHFFKNKKLIVQTHVSVINDRLIRQLLELNVKVVEIGFESANDTLLKASNKVATSAKHESAIKLLHSNGFSVVLNVLGGLPFETRESHDDTIRFLLQTSSYVWLYNLYSFVPYPKTPIFSELKERIINWNFSEWREDMPPIFEPYHMSGLDLWELYLEKVRVCTKILESRK
ncbi:B12-binding domain-containing radical SAM protein [Pseudomonas syringae]|uniref:B12-binding domain-containing radical SAM protein n=1 Tax=Pseudomonas syringae TaxID=317 RepID=UPI00164CD020|nr:radical SAM protein [Pseudomonas syringae]